MTLIWIEGWETFGTTNGIAPDDMSVKYADVSTQSSTDIEAGFVAGKSWETGSGNAWITTPSLGAITTFITGFRFKYSVALAATRFFTAFEPTADALSLNMRLGVTGLISVYRGNTLLGTSSSGLMTSTWHFIELKAFISNTVGTVDVVVDGANVLSLTGLDTLQGSGGDTDWGQFNLRGAGVSNAYTFDDWYICDDNGSVNNDFLGNVRVDAVFADGAGANSDWTPSAGSNYQNVDENPSDDDTTYNEDSVSNNVDTHTYAAMPAVGVIAGVQINTIARLTDASPFNLETVIISNVTTSNDTGQAVTSSYSNVYRIAESDPDTAVAWLEAGINAAEFGYEIP